MNRIKNKSESPNILLIMCDQLCASVLESYGGTAESPNITLLAENGVRFDGAYCQTPFCTPSRASILTGLYPHRHGIVGNLMFRDYDKIAGCESEKGICNDDVTTEGLLYERGYDTVHSGKWHISGEDLRCYKTMYREHQEYGREMRGFFERIEAEVPRERYMDWYGWKLPVAVDSEYAETMSRCDIDWPHMRLKDYVTKFGRLEIPLEDTFDYRIASRGVDAIRTAKEPFMLTCSFNMPHDPNVVPSPYYESVDMSRIHADASLPCDEMYQNDLSKRVPLQAGNIFLREFLRIYHAAIKLVDDQIGRLLAALEERGILDGTVILFTADHGDMAGGHGMFYKSTPGFYEEMARVPLIISAPGYNKGSTYKKPVELTDIMPTILELCGMKSAVPENIDGISLVPALSGSSTAKDTALSERLPPQPDGRRITLTGDNNANKNFQFMLRSGKYKYIVNRRGDWEKRLLFDLENDPNEYDNLIGQSAYDSAAADMHALLQARLAETGYILM